MNYLNEIKWNQSVDLPFAAHHRPWLWNMWAGLVQSQLLHHLQILHHFYPHLMLRHPCADHALLLRVHHKHGEGQECHVSWWLPLWKAKESGERCDQGRCAVISSQIHSYEVQLNQSLLLYHYLPVAIYIGWKSSHSVFSSFLSFLILPLVCPMILISFTCSLLVPLYLSCFCNEADVCPHSCYPLFYPSRTSPLLSCSPVFLKLMYLVPLF